MKRDSFIVDESRENTSQTSRKDLDPNCDKWMLLQSNGMGCAHLCRHYIQETDQQTEYLDGGGTGGAAGERGEVPPWVTSYAQAGGYGREFLKQAVIAMTITRLGDDVSSSSAGRVTAFLHFPSTT